MYEKRKSYRKSVVLLRVGIFIYECCIYVRCTSVSGCVCVLVCMCMSVFFFFRKWYTRIFQRLVRIMVGSDEFNSLVAKLKVNEGKKFTKRILN